MKREYIVTIKVKSLNGVAPEVRTICGDTIFVSMEDGQTATWKLKRVPKRKRKWVK